MDWNIVISHNHAILVRVIASLFAMLHSGETRMSGTIPRTLFNSITLILRTAESAVRRLIIIAARDIKVKPRRPQPFPFGHFLQSNSTLVRAPRFNLIDPLKMFSLKGEPNSTVNGVEPGFAHASQQILSFEPAVNVVTLSNRLRAMRLALDNLPQQARRLARWRAQRNFDLRANPRLTRLSPFRPGPPPGLRKRPSHEVDAVLRDVHYFAREAWHWKDTT